MSLTTEGKRLYLETPAGKTDIGLPIQSVLDGMDFQAKEEHGTVYVWSDDEVYVWREADGWSKAVKL